MLKFNKFLIIPVFLIVGLIFIVIGKFSTFAGKKCVIPNKVNKINSCAKVDRTIACGDENYGVKKADCTKDKVTDLIWQPGNRCYSVAD